ncbi:MAG TPA: hypothetical protein PKD70_01830 [Saprospiraceae bacterium]|nr:hypothetical protein [Saprospiraceae bacterium]HMP12589.1 hypothetical protein [Saprospiraceae bacterium]
MEILEGSSLGSFFDGADEKNLLACHLYIILTAKAAENFSIKAKSTASKR